MDLYRKESDSSDDSCASYHSIEHPSFTRDGNRPHEMGSHHAATLINPGPPVIYQLKTERKYVHGTKKVRRWTYGRRDKNKQNKVILLVGETGAGKTSLTNTMINYLLGVKFDDQEFYQITEETEEHKSQRKSQTSKINVYEVFVDENPTSLTIIDTPGYGNTGGYEKDREISEYLTKLFTDEDGIHYIDAVCFVMKATQNRLSGKELYVFHSVMSLFGRDIENSIVFMITHSDGGPPTDALDAIKTAEIPCRKNTKKQPFHFLFNNRKKEKRDKQFDHIYRSSWEMGERSINELFTLLEGKNRKSVRLTLDVLKERSQLEACVDNLKERISEKDLKMKELNQIQEGLRQNRENIEKCKNSELRVTRCVKEKVSIENTSWRYRNTTCCSICEENCHENCWWVNDLAWCEAMRNNYCTVCIGKCHYSKHVRENKKYVMKTKEVEMKFEDFEKGYEHNGDQNVTSFDREEYKKNKKKLENNMKESENKTKEEEKMKRELENITCEKSKLLHDAYIRIVSLSKVALKSDSAFTLQHLDFLIPMLKEEGKDEWMKNLEDLRKAGEEENNKLALHCVQELKRQ